jgi:hypothetical protein
LEKSNGILQKKGKAERLLQILFNTTEHSSYFGKLPFEKENKAVEKFTNRGWSKDNG